MRSLQFGNSEILVYRRKFRVFVRWIISSNMQYCRHFVKVFVFGFSRGPRTSPRKFFWRVQGLDLLTKLGWTSYTRVWLVNICGIYTAQPIWVNLITTPKYREVHDSGGRKEHARKQLNRIEGTGLEVQL